MCTYCRFLVLLMVYSRGTSNLPGPESKHEAHPGKQEDSAIWVHRVQHRDASGLFVDGIDLGGLPQMGNLETHV